MSNNLRTRNGMPFNFVNGLKVRGMDIESLIPGIEGIPEAGSKYQFAGDGTNKSFTLPVSPYNKDAVDVYVKQLYVHPDDYTLVGDTVTLVEAPPAVMAGETYNVVIKVSLTTLNGYVNANRVSFEGENLDDILEKGKPLANYSSLRAYAGAATQVRITDPGIAGFFYYDAADITSVDNGGTIIVSSDGKRWKRFFNGAVDVSWFGAFQDLTGAGSVNNTTAIQAAINYSSANLKVVFLPGFYVVGKIKLPSNTHLHGRNYKQSGLKLAPGSNSNLLENENLVTGNTNIFVDNLTLDFNYAAQSIAAGNNDIGNGAFFQNCSFVFVSKCYAKSAWQAAIHFLGCSDSQVVDSIATETAKDTTLGLAAFYCENSDRILFDRNNVFSASGSGVGSIGGKDVVCTNNIARSVGATAFTINSLRGRVQNNTVDTTTFANGITCGHGVDVSGTVISGNIIRGASNSGIALSSGANIVISANFIEACGGTSISFASGSFNRVAITGNTINANGKLAIGASAGVSLFGITACGNTIENCSRVTYSESTDGFIFSGNIVKECASYGVYFTGSVKRVSVVDNLFENANAAAIIPVALIGATHSTIARNRIKNLTSTFTLQVHATNKVADNQLDDDGVNEVATVTSLPTASALWRGRYVRQLGEFIGVNQADRLFICKKLGDGLYAWSQVD